MSDSKNSSASQYTKDVVDKIKSSQEQVANAAENTEDVKAGKCTADDEKHEPAYILYKGITDSVVSIYQDPKFIELLQDLINKDSKDPKPFVDLMTMVTVHATYESIVFYDELLKSELTKQLDQMVDYMNNLKQENVAFNSVLQVYKKRLDALASEKKISEFNKANNIQ